MPVKLLCGNDEYSISSELQKIRKTVLTEDFADLNRKFLIEKLPKQIDISDILQAIETVSMFGNLLVEVHSTSLFARGKADNEKLLDRLVSDIKNLPDNVYLVFACTFPKEDDKKKIDSAKKIVKTIKEVGEIKEFAAFKFFETDKVIDWIMKSAKSKKIILSHDNAALLQSFAGSDLRTLNSELEKIKTYILPSNEVKKEDIINLSQDNEDAFKVLDMWLKGDKYALLSELDKLLIKDAPQKVIALMQTTIKRWLRIKLEAEFSSSQEIAKTIGAHPFFVQNEMTKLRNVDKNKLLNLRKALNKAEYQMKSGDIKSNVALEMALVQ